MTLTWITQAENLLLPATGWGRRGNANRTVASAMPLPYFKISWVLYGARSKRQAWPNETLGNLLLRLLSGHALFHVLAAPPQTPGSSTLCLASVALSLPFTPTRLSTLQSLTGASSLLWSLLSPSETSCSFSGIPNTALFNLEVSFPWAHCSCSKVPFSLCTVQRQGFISASLSLLRPSTKSVPNKWSQQQTALAGVGLFTRPFR